MTKTRSTVVSPGGPDRPRTGLKGLKARVKVRGLAAIDTRTTAARALLDWRRELLDDLGGMVTVSAAQLALVEVATRTRLYLDHVDAHLLEQPTLLTRRNRLKPLVEQRTRLADSLIAVLTRLGLEKRKPAAPSLESYIAARYSRTDEIPQSPQDRRSAARAEEELAEAAAVEHSASAEPTQATESLLREQPASGARATDPTHEEPDA